VRPLAAARGIRLDEGDIRTCTYNVSADRQRLKQVLLNLLSNAVKYNREGGLVTLSCQVLNEVSDGLPVQKIRMAVKDSGAGIDPSLRTRLFTPFDRLGAENSTIEGTGMGLSLSRHLARAMNGRLDFESEVGQGSTFWIELPRAADSIRSAEPLPLAAEKEEFVGTRLVVLYIEDNPSNLQLVQRLLAHRPEIRLLTAMQGGLGYELARQHQPDLILLDMNLPDVPGQDVLRHLRDDDKTQSIPVIVVSADATPGQIERMLQAGAKRYLTKPFDVREFLSILDDHIPEAEALTR
jgi:CheY-like chemotaxis protein